jgi:hypothetical protein
VLLPPVGQLSGDGQLRELIAELRGCQGGTARIWYLLPTRVAAMALGHEAVVTPSSAVVIWLQLSLGRSSASSTP